MKAFSILMCFIFLTGCTDLPNTIDKDSAKGFLLSDGYKLNSKYIDVGAKETVIIVHGGPGGDYSYLQNLGLLQVNNNVFFYDQRGTGLSPRVNKEWLTFEQNVKDLKDIVDHFNGLGHSVRLIGHSWGGMLVVKYLSIYTEKVQKAIVIEPGFLNQAAAFEYSKIMNAHESLFSILKTSFYVMQSIFISGNPTDKYDYVMTKYLNADSKGSPYNCENEKLPSDTFVRAGYDAFMNMLKPIIMDPTLFKDDISTGLKNYKGKLLFVDTECSLFGRDFQRKYHLNSLPSQTKVIHLDGVGHNVVTMKPEKIIPILKTFLDEM